MHVNRLLVSEREGGLGDWGSEHPASVQSPAPGSGDVQIRRPSLPSQILWPHREMSQTQEKVQWKVGSKGCGGVVERVWTGDSETRHLFQLSLISHVILGQSFHHSVPQFPHR